MGAERSRQAAIRRAGTERTGSGGPTRPPNITPSLRLSPPAPPPRKLESSEAAFVGRACQ